MITRRIIVERARVLLGHGHRRHSPCARLIAPGITARGAALIMPLVAVGVIHDSIDRVSDEALGQIAKRIQCVGFDGCVAIRWRYLAAVAPPLGPVRALEVPETCVGRP